MKSSDIYIRAISQEMPQPAITKICLKITSLKFHSNFTEANELMVADPFPLYSFTLPLFHYTSSTIYQQRDMPEQNLARLKAYRWHATISMFWWTQQWVQWAHQWGCYHSQGIAIITIATAASAPAISQDPWSHQWYHDCRHNNGGEITNAWKNFRLISREEGKECSPVH